MDALTLIRESLAPLAGKRIVDIGCGPGALARRMPPGLGDSSAEILAEQLEYLEDARDALRTRGVVR